MPLPPRGPRPASARSATSDPSATGSLAMARFKLASPTKPSLRRDSSLADEYDTANRNPLGSYPLPRQSSVSWAETLVNVREIDDVAAIEWTDDRITELIHAYLVALLRTARIIAGCFIRYM